MRQPTEPFRLDVAGYRLLRGQRPVRLERQPMELLILLAGRPGDLVTREDIAARLWGDTVFVDLEHSINRIVRKLRTALHDDAARPRFIETVVGKGYRLVGPLEVSIRSIAVLPFANLSADPAQDYLAEGTTEELITRLGAVGGLRVVSRTSVSRFRNTTESLRAVGRELDVDAIVEGSASREGRRVRLTVKLIQVPSERALWARSYDCDVQDALAVHAEIVEAIAGLAREPTTGEASPRRAARPRPPARRRPDAAASDSYVLYMKGRYYWNKRPAAGMVQKAIELFQQATEADPTFALAYAALADCYNTLGAWEASGLAPQAAFPRARVAAERALELRPDLAEAQTAKAYAALHFEWDFDQAEAGFERALQLNRNYVHCHHWRAHLLAACGRFDEALAESRRIIELDPLDLIVNVHLAWHFQMAHDFPNALDASGRTLEMEPNFHWGHFFAGWAYEQLGEPGKAVDALTRSVQLSGGSTVMRSALAHALARAGDHAAARRILAELEGLRARCYVSPYELGLIHLALDDADRGWTLLEQACIEHSGWMPYVGCEPRLMPLHDDARFRGLVARVGAQPAARGRGLVPHVDRV